MRTLSAGLSGDENVNGAHLTNDATDDQLRITISDDGCVLRQPFAVTSKRLVTGRSADDFNPPWLWSCRFLRRGQCRTRWNRNLRTLVTGEVSDGSKIQRDVLSARPFFDRAAGHPVHVGPRFTRKQTTSSEPVANAPGSGVVGSCGKTEIAKLPIQIAQ